MPIIEWLLSIGKLTEAWEFYIKLQWRIEDASEILKVFLFAVGNLYDSDHDNMAFISADPGKLKSEDNSYRPSY